jgi:neuronal cell adhesion molecule
MFSIVVLSSLFFAVTLGSPPVLIQQQVESEVLFKVSPTDDRHRPFELLCEAESDPKPEYRWIKDGKVFDITSMNVRILRKPESGTLKFVKPSDEDEGEYYCIAENSDGIVRSNEVTLKKAFLHNFVNESVRVVEAHEGDPLQLECEAPSGYPSPSIFWIIQTKHGAIKSADNARVTLDPVGNLWFSAVSLEDASKDSHYVCSAASTFVNEYYLGNRITLKVIPRNNKTWETRPPTLQYATPEEVVVLKGKKLEIFCIYSGDPLPEIAWSKDGHTVWKSERVVRENHGKSLKIRNADAADAGKYKCKCSSRLYLRHFFEKLFLSPPIFLSAIR